MIFLETDMVKKSFRKVREDIDALRSNLTEWLVFLNGRQKEQEERIKKLERRLFELEQERVI